MTGLTAFLLLLCGFAALALSMPKHHRDLFGCALQPALGRALRWGGWASLALALVTAITGSGVSVGIVLWFGLATLAALIVAVMLTYRSLWWRT